METEDSDEEEEMIVYASFEKGTIERDIFNFPNLHWKMIGLDSETPILQLGETTFKGEWNDTIGTKLLFEEDPSPGQVDPAFTVLPSTMLKYMGQTTKALDFTRIFLKPKNSDPEQVPVMDPEQEALEEQEQALEMNLESEQIDIHITKLDVDDEDIDNEFDEENSSYTERDIMDLAASTTNPSNETDSVMETIVSERLTEL